MARGVSASAPSCTTEVVAAADEGREVDGDVDADLLDVVAPAAAIARSILPFYFSAFSSSVFGIPQMRALAGGTAR